MRVGMKKGPEGDLFHGEGMDYFQPLMMVNADDVVAIF